MSRLTGRNARLSDVAEAAGVSKATASNVFNRPELVREEVRLRVQEMAKRIGYAGPDPKGRLLSAGRVNAIGVATGEPLAYFFDDPYARAMMKGIAEVCDANGIGVSLVSVTEDEAIWNIRTALVDGLILFCLEGADRLVASSRERGAWRWWGSPSPTAARCRRSASTTRRAPASPPGTSSSSATAASPCLPWNSPRTAPAARSTWRALPPRPMPRRATG